MCGRRRRRRDAKQLEFFNHGWTRMNPDHAGQLELDLAGERIETVWNRNMQEHSHEWSEEAFCVIWLSGGSAPDWDWWRGLQEYERRAWLQDYHLSKSLTPPGSPRPTPQLVFAERARRMDETKALATVWAKELRQAFKEGRTNPITPAPAFEHVLEMAIDIAGIPAHCLYSENPDSCESVSIRGSTIS